MACASGRPKELGLQVQVVEVESARKAPQTPNAARVRLILINMLSRNQHQFPHAVHVHPIYNKSRMLTLGFLGAPLAPPPVILSRSSIDMDVRQAVCSRPDDWRTSPTCGMLGPALTTR